MSDHTFSSINERRGTGCRKWDNVTEVFGAEDILPFWIADMDFLSPPAVREALTAKAAHGIYGYNTVDPSYIAALQHWLQNRHGWTVEAQHILTAPGVVPSISLAIQAFSAPGDEIIIQPPVYPPFSTCITRNDRIVVENPLISDNGYYRFDLDDLRQKISPRTRMLILCSPHNPVGRVWTAEELTALADICLKNNLIILADEIHHDLVFSGHRHIPMANISAPVGLSTITLVAPSKTFNIAGLHSSFIIAADPAKYKTLTNTLNALGIGGPHLFAAAAGEAAYAKGAGWLDELLPYLAENAAVMADYLGKHLPGVRMVKPEGTYLAWLDFREIFAFHDALRHFLAKEARVGLNDGLTFGSPGSGFARFNFACPRDLLLAGLERMRAAWEHRR